MGIVWGSIWNVYCKKRINRAYNYKGIFFKVVTAGEEDHFPKRIYMLGIDGNNSTLYYLYLEDHDLDFKAEPNEQDLEGAMGKRIADQFNLGK